MSQTKSPHGPLLNPYDTGERAEPVPWISGNPHTFRPLLDHDADRFGKVDYEDAEGRTLATVWVERDESGEYIIRVAHFGDRLRIEEVAS
ncbi:hypothetical protein E4U02_15200 [Microbacterium paludicola]|uniref:Uncharacterized protein n=1 Tax=Microbacterium paludicola TaxID=300019 RepID=A0A4Y9FNB0_9MICO|nr:hypothetical protein [Microbacterium paludicola]MBF0817751.1 hypothetical protein [Microbacterium paludicola]TFU30000.1 hypothetical protein E4U02_15200 [Microbacterium paludicola]